MAESPIRVGDSVLVLTGLFRGLDGVVQTIDATADAVVVRVELLGRPHSLPFALSAVERHLTPFGDQPPLATCPDEERYKAELLSLCPNADATYRISFWQSMTLGHVQVIRRGMDVWIHVRSHNMTWPARETMQWAVSQTPLTGAEWAAFHGLVEECGFWGLPYDDGRRFPRASEHYQWRIEGYEDGRYHAVVRQRGQPESEVSACCNYLRKLAEGRSFDA